MYLIGQIQYIYAPNWTNTKHCVGEKCYMYKSLKSAQNESFLQLEKIVISTYWLSGGLFSISTKTSTIDHMCDIINR